MARRIGLVAFDPPPFSHRQAIVTLSGLLITTMVLIGQHQLAKLEPLRGQIELQGKILTEQKTTTLIRRLEQLRRDRPMVHERHDADAVTLQRPTDATRILTTLEQEPQRSGQPAGNSRR